MRRKYFSIATAISAAFLVAACTQTDVVDDMASVQGGLLDDNAISFSTYSAKKGSTRAGYEGNMTDKQLKETLTNKGGFGVFAYHTKQKYEDYRGTGGASVGKANFMYNQDVTYNTAGSYWTYDPLKYWPNDFVGGAVDDKTPPAQGSGTNGYVSFFAYAPYVSYADVKAEVDGKGITDMTAANETGEPKIEYTLGKNVDLLWGTLDKDETGENVVGTANEGVTGNKNASAGTYANEIVDGRAVAANLTKQKVDGQVKFNFIHALAAIGGNEESEGGSNQTMSAGFEVKLVLDNNEDGKPLGTITGVDGAIKKGQIGGKPGVQTVVTIESIKIEDATIKATDAGFSGEGITSDTEFGELTQKASLNLATGKWGGQVPGGKVNQTIGTPTTDTAADDATSVALNPEIAENKIGGGSYFNNNEYFTDEWIAENNHPGVTTAARSVYKNKSVSPLLFIPGDRPVLKITVKYIVRTYDKNLDGECSTVENTISKVVVFPVVEMNKHYSLLMQLGLTSVKFDATVSDWDNVNPGDSGSSEPTEGDNSSDGIIDLPANVVGTEAGN